MGHVQKQGPPVVTKSHMRRKTAGTPNSWNTPLPRLLHVNSQPLALKLLNSAGATPSSIGFAWSQGFNLGSFFLEARVLFIRIAIGVIGHQRMLPDHHLSFSGGQKAKSLRRPRLGSQQAPVTCEACCSLPQSFAAPTTHLSHLLAPAHP